MTIDRDKINSLLVAFSVRDIQVANTILSWLYQNGVSAVEFQTYVRGWMEVNRLHTLGYFTTTKDHVGDSVRARELERKISDRDVRRYVRKMRLNNTPFNFASGGCGCGKNKIPVGVSEVLF